VLTGAAHGRATVPETVASTAHLPHPLWRSIATAVRSAAARRRPKRGGACGGGEEFPRVTGAGATRGMGKTLDHLFFSCPLARYVQNMISVSFGFNRPFSNVHECVNVWLKGIKLETYLVFRENDPACRF
jgi:hypothetical protein